MNAQVEGSASRYDGMTVTPTLSPWPAPTLADLAPGQSPPTPEPDAPQVIDPPQQRPIAALLNTARRLSSRTERAAHATLKEEQKIGAELADLPAGWFVLASLDIECLDHHDPDDLHVDHVVIGPGGVFTIYVEHQPGAKVWVSEHAVTINGRESNRLRRARFEARRSSRASDRCLRLQRHGAIGLDADRRRNDADRESSSRSARAHPTRHPRLAVPAAAAPRQRHGPGDLRPGAGDNKEE